MNANLIRLTAMMGIWSALSASHGLTAEPARVTSQPQPQSVLEGCPATFVAGVSGTPPIVLQWHRDGMALPGETNATLTISSVALADHGARFRVTATNAFGGDASMEVPLTVLADITRPVLQEAGGDASRWRVFVRFGGGACQGPRLDKASAETADNYTLRSAGGTSFTVFSATLDASGTLVTLITDYLNQDVLYTLSVQNVMDVSGNAVEPNSSVSFRAPWPVPNAVLVERYRLPATGCTESCPIFPCSTNLHSREWVHFFETLPSSSPTGHVPQCVRVSSYFIPPISGRWIFHLRSSEPARLYTGTMGANPDGVRELINATNCCEPFPATASTPVYLQANQPCYLEGHYQESTGPGYLQVAARLEGDPNPPEQLTRIPAEYLRPPAGSAGLITILTQPQDASTVFGSVVTFSVAASATSLNPLVPFPSLHYQWQRSEGYFSDIWEDLLDATNAVYSTPVQPDCAPLFPGRYRCQLFTAGARATTRPASLIVIIVDEFPFLIDVVASPTLDAVTVTYSARMTPDTIGDLFNYDIPGLMLDSVEIISPREARLHTERQIPNQVYQLFVTGMRSAGVNGCGGMEMLPASRQFQAWRLMRGTATREVFFGIPGATLTDLRNSGKYPLSPDRIDSVRELDAGTQAASFNLADNYGLRISGFLEPPVTQAYDFYLAADDTGEFWLSSNRDPTNLTLVCQSYFPGSWRDWGGFPAVPPQTPERWSRALFPNGIVLQAGQYYAFEALLKEGFGTDHLAVAWTRAGDPVPTNGSPAISGSVLASHGRGIEALRSGSTLALSWTLGGTLQSAPTMEGPWSSVPGVPFNANSLTVPLTDESRFYRVWYSP